MKSRVTSLLDLALSPLENMEENGCIFCDIVGRKVPTELVGENEGAVAFYDQSPSAETHILIVPRSHRPTFLDLTGPESLNSMKDLAHELIRDLKLEGAYRLIFNGGSYQHVPHVHWHLLSGQLNSLGLDKITKEP